MKQEINEENKNTNKPKKKLSKRAILLIVNAVAFIVLCAIGYVAALGSTPFPAWFQVFSLYAVLLQVIFSCMSLVVYYLSIIVDAMSKKHVDKEDKTK